MAIALPDSLPESLSLDAVACGTQSLLDTLVGLSPGWLQPAESLIGSDVVSLLRLQVSAESVLRLGVSPGLSADVMCAICGGYVLTPSPCAWHGCILFVIEPVVLACRGLLRV